MARDDTSPHPPTLAAGLRNVGRGKYSNEDDLGEMENDLEANVPGSQTLEDAGLSKEPKTVKGDKIPSDVFWKTPGTCHDDRQTMVVDDQ